MPSVREISAGAGSELLRWRDRAAEDLIYINPRDYCGVHKELGAVLEVDFGLYCRV
jgi:hypothetical protein